MIETLLFSGGGVKFLSYFGALKALKESNTFNLKQVGGVSSGSMFGLALVLGIDMEELEKNVIDIDFSKCLKFKTRFLNYLGIDDGNEIMYIMKQTFSKYCEFFNQDTTFKELYEITKIQYDVYATNLNKSEMVKFNYINTPNLRVVHAIRMSISIPFIFTIKKYNGDVYVDGALSCNFPAKEYFVDGVLPETFFGMMICKKEKINTTSLKGYITAIFYNMIKVEKYDRVLYIQGIEEHSLNFNISKKHKQNLIKHGYNCMIKSL